MGRFVRSLLASICVAVACGTAHAAVAEDGLVLAPSSDWRFREYDDRCRASRVFGEGEDRTTLWIEQGGDEQSYNITLIGRPLRHPYGGGIRIRFGDEPEIIRSYLTAKSSRDRPVLMMYGVRIVQPSIERGEQDASPEIDISDERAQAIDRLRLRTSIVEPIELELGPMGIPFRFLADCGEKLSVLLTEAGRALTREASAPVAIDPEDWVQDRDYPRYLVRAEMQGRIMARITVNKSGAPSSCFVVESNKPQLFDDAVCLALMRRARFEPARNARGEPVASYYFYRVSFRIE